MAKRHHISDNAKNFQRRLIKWGLFGLVVFYVPFLYWVWVNFQVGYTPYPHPTKWDVPTPFYERNKP